MSRDSGGERRMSTFPGCTRSFIGIAPNANIINLRVLDANGNGTDSSVISAIDAAIGLARIYNIKSNQPQFGAADLRILTHKIHCVRRLRAHGRANCVCGRRGNGGGIIPKARMATNYFGSGERPYVISVGAMKDMRTIVAATI